MKRYSGLLKLLSLVLGLTVCALIVSYNACDSNKIEITPVLYYLSVITLLMWFLCMFMCIMDSNLKIKEMFKTKMGIYIIFTFVPCFMIPVLVISQSNKMAELDSDINNVAILGTVLSSYLIISIFMNDQKRKEIFNSMKKYYKK